MEDKGRYIVSSLIYAFIASALISVLLYLFMASVPVEYVVDLITYFANNPGVICAVIFAELFLVIAILEVFRVVFDSGKTKVSRPVKKEKSAPKKASTKKVATKKTTKKAAK